MSSKKIKTIKAVPENLKKLNRKQIRYWCFRFQKEKLEGTDSSGAPDGMKEYFESMDWFSSWDTFAIKWDINQDNFLKIIPLKIDPNVEWDETLWSEAKVITGKE